MKKMIAGVAMAALLLAACGGESAEDEPEAAAPVDVAAEISSIEALLDDVEQTHSEGDAEAAAEIAAEAYLEHYELIEHDVEEADEELNEELEELLGNDLRDAIQDGISDAELSGLLDEIRGLLDEAETAVEQA